MANTIQCCEKCLKKIVNKEIEMLSCMLEKDECCYPTELTKEDLFLDDEDDKKFFYAFNDENKFSNWWLKVMGKPHKMFHPSVEKYIYEVQEMLEQTMNELYNALEGNYEIIRNNSNKNIIEKNKIINKNIRKLNNDTKNKSDWYVYLTLRPPESVTIEEFITKVEKIHSLGCISEFWYSYEQTDDTDTKTYEGKHIHSLIKFNTNQNFGNAYQQLKRAVDATKWYNKHQKYIGDEIWSDKLYYIGVLWTDNDNYENNMLNNYKNEEYKNKRLEYDRKFREEIGQPYVINSYPVSSQTKVPTAV